MNEAKRRRMRDRLPGAATLINQGCKISGAISGTGNFMISGEIDGDCDVQGTVTVSADGLWQGTIKAESVIVSGRVEGDIMAGGKVEIRPLQRSSAPLQRKLSRLLKAPLWMA